ncbi:MAG: hypothetical protein ACRC5R_02635 [Mycoplasmatales bacterium]
MKVFGVMFIVFLISAVIVSSIFVFFFGGITESNETFAYLITFIITIIIYTIINKKINKK